ncbi:MAG: 4Fe-4S binding protein [Methanomicrobiales archaeon]|nr:4Fe-4S binding protein [Methanomicrobiales archaeon]
MIVVIAYLWYSGQWQQKIGWLVLVVSAGLGFLIFAPVVPWQFQQIVLRDEQGLGAPLIVGVIGLTFVFFLTLILGRFFCGYLCPVGAVQEIAYHTPVPKTNPHQKNAFMAVRAIVFVLFLVMAFILSASLLAGFGVRDFFYLSLTAGTFVFTFIVLLSITLYRPFCRLVCPYGALLSLGAWKSILIIQRTDACIECKKCEKACPTDEAKRNDGKAECYLCGRCVDVCPTPGALIYKRRNADGNK